MLKFYYDTSNHFTDRIKRKLQDMVAAHKIIKTGFGQKLPKDIQPKELPVLSDGHKLYSTEGEITQYLKDLHKELEIGREMQSDSCHIDPDNPEECL